MNICKIIYVILILQGLRNHHITHLVTTILKKKKNPGFVKFNIIFQSFANAQLSMMEFIHFAVIQPTGNMS